MATILFIRHAQASAHLEDYDQLSDLGFKQCQFLQHYLSKHSVDRIYVGPRKRHLQTYEQVAQPDWPSPILTPLLDEFPAEEMVKHGLDTLLSHAPESKTLVDALQSQTGTAGNAYPIVLHKLTQLWTQNKLDENNIESHKHYQSRLAEMIQQLNQPQTGIQLVFTSAGTISSIMGQLVMADPFLAIQCAWRLYNASVMTAMVCPNLPQICTFNTIHFIPEQYRSKY